MWTLAAFAKLEVLNIFSSLKNWAYVTMINETVATTLDEMRRKIWTMNRWGFGRRRSLIISGFYTYIRPDVQNSAQEISATISDNPTDILIILYRVGGTCWG
jgi:hypothetical protein